MNATRAICIAIAFALCACSKTTATPPPQAPETPISIASGEAMLEQGDYEEAARVFTTLLSTSSDDAHVHYYLGLALKRMGKADQARSHYEKALTLKPDLVEAQVNLGLVLLELGDLERAERLLRAYADANDAEADAHYNLGLVLQERGSAKEALSHYRRAVELDPEFAEAQLGVGELLLAGGQAAEAVRNLVAVGQMGHSESTTEAGILLAKAGYGKEAEQLYKAALSQDGTDPTVHFLLANLLARSTRFEEAIAEYEMYLEKGADPVTIESARSRIAACRTRLGR